MNLGLDVDGVLADFNIDYVQRILDVTKENRFGDAPLGLADRSWPPVWNYPEAAGYSNKQMGEVWRSIRKDESFWYNINPLAGAEKVLTRLSLMREDGDDIYFITARPGFQAKLQTERWLMDLGMSLPTVLMAADKAAAADLLALDAYIDDKLENVNLTMQWVRAVGGLMRVYLLDAPYNRRDVANLDEDDGIFNLSERRDPALKVVGSVMEMLKMEGF